MAAPVPSPESNASRAALLRYQAAMIQARLSLPGDLPADAAPLFRSLLDSSLSRSGSPLDALSSQSGLLGTNTSGASGFLPSALAAPSASLRGSSGLLDALPPALSSTTRPVAGVVRPVLQADTSEYASSAEARTWAASSCSAASLTAVLRSVGSTARVGDVVRALQTSRGITVAQGLTSRSALVDVARRFGLDAQDRAMTYDQLGKAAATGPVLVDIKNARFPEGHWLAVTAADANGVSLVDSSGFQLTHMTRAELQAAWSGRGVVFAPGSALVSQEATRA